MAFQTNDSEKPMSDINVTPFVDVILVLLLVFMVSAPLMFNNIDLSLPKTKKVNKLKLSKENIVLSVNKKGEFYLGKKSMNWDQVVDFFNKNDAKNQKIYIRADFSLPYGQVAHILSELKRLGLQSISLVTQTES